MTDKLSWGIIGCGDVVEHKSGPSILASGGSRIAGVMRRDAAKARAFAEANKIDICTDDPEAILNNGDIDIVYVATPPSSHSQYVIAAAKAGKHVLVEKPMGLSADQDREMIDACKAAGVELFVAYYRRFHPHVLKMKQLIDSGRIGKPVMAQIDYAQPPAPNTNWGGGWRVQPKISGGGLFVDVVSHRIDLLVYLLGSPLETRGITITTEPQSRVEQSVSLAVRFEGDVAASISGDFASPRRADRFVITGEKGVIDSNHLDGHSFSLQTGETIEQFNFDRLVAPHLGLVQHIEAVLKGQQPNASSGQDALQTDQILDKALNRD